MRTEQTPNWRLGIGLTLSMILGLVWGFLLGWMQVRVNAVSSSWLGAGIALPAAFVGSLSVGWIAQRALRPWHKVARLLAALIAVAIGLPIGLGWGLVAAKLDAASLFAATGALVWNYEWLAAILGLFAGMWTGWTQPITRRIARWIARPRPFAHTLGEKFRRPLDALLNFFEAFGRASLWLPLEIYRRWHRPAPQPPPAPQIKIAEPRRIHRAATRLAKTASGARVMRVVEERCPYCLDVITRNDPRGIHTCDICGAPHHADCWAITGRCQVPHLNP